METSDIDKGIQTSQWQIKYTDWNMETRPVGSLVASPTRRQGALLFRRHSLESLWKVSQNDSWDCHQRARSTRKATEIQVPTIVVVSTRGGNLCRKWRRDRHGGFLLQTPQLWTLPTISRQSTTITIIRQSSLIDESRVD
jgi:hypothetical protein